ncbi:translation initiation factor Sui1 [Desulfovermiculus halophilus]|jgi:translation initiation factor 1|uniref:translation initiation factor Sui1 n=1 Tax=Desulfovermiculus halophilus TaxID=339722 RepID=UPI0004887AD7|nr:translation initiation factor Sui1 [Desulfovermiculus halophilus]
MSMQHQGNARPVYSTEDGKMCPGCGRAQADCGCKTKTATPAGDGIVRVGRETKGRKGKGVSIISGLPLEGQELAGLAKRLKNKCGSGGTVKNGVIEIQGDHRNLLVEELKKEGFTVKRSGG